MPAASEYEKTPCDKCGKNALSLVERKGTPLTRYAYIACPWCGHAQGVGPGVPPSAWQVWDMLFSRHGVKNLSDLKVLLLREGVMTEQSEECPACGTLSLLLSSRCQECGTALPLYAKFLSKGNVVYRGTRPGQDTKVTIEDKDLPLHLDLVSHSPTGFEWGYSGSGPHQLALAMAAECLAYYLPEKETAERLALKRYHLLLPTVSTLPKEGPWEIDRKTVFSILSAT